MTHSTHPIRAGGALALAALLALAGCGRSQPAAPEPRQIHIVGSSALYPFSTAVAERFTRANAQAVAPLVRAGGTGAGIAAFCGGLGRDHPDVVGVTRPITEAETAGCRAHGVHALATLPLGYGALVLVQAKDEPPIALTRADLYRALAGNAENWSDVDPRLPRRPIRVEGPAADPAIGDDLFALLLTPGCRAAEEQSSVRPEEGLSVGKGPSRRALRDAASTSSAASQDERSGLSASVFNNGNCDRPAIRRDGAYRGHGADAELVASAVAAAPGAIGILPWPAALRHADNLSPIALDGVIPSTETIASGRYPARQTLALIVKANEAAAVPGLIAILRDYLASARPGGDFTTRVLVPLPSKDRAEAERKLQAIAAR